MASAGKVIVAAAPTGCAAIAAPHPRRPGARATRDAAILRRLNGPVRGRAHVIAPPNAPTAAGGGAA